MRRGRALLVGLLVLVAVTGLWSLATGVAALAAWQADRMTERAPGAALADDQVARRLLSLARHLDPINPAHDEQLAKHEELVALQTRPGSAAERPWLTQARAHYRAAALRRPTWPLGLTSVLRTDYKLGRWDQGFTALYARAADLGRSEPASLRVLIDLGLAAWPALDGEGREAVLALLRHGLLLTPNDLLERAVAWRRGGVVAPLIASDPELRGLYASIRARAAGSP